MFNLNENNRIMMSRHPGNRRMDVNCLCRQVRSVAPEPSRARKSVSLTLNAAVRGQRRQVGL